MQLVLNGQTFRGKAWEYSKLLPDLATHILLAQSQTTKPNLVDPMKITVFPCGFGVSLVAGAFGCLVSIIDSGVLW